jgi:hypothetical protein
VPFEAGRELVAAAILRWLADAGIDTALIDPGKPWQSATDESFNRKFREEYLPCTGFETGSIRSRHCSAAPPACSFRRSSPGVGRATLFPKDRLSAQLAVDVETL